VGLFSHQTVKNVVFYYPGIGQQHEHKEQTKKHGKTKKDPSNFAANTGLK